jgi:hypothetical protein
MVLAKLSGTNFSKVRQAVKNGIPFCIALFKKPFFVFKVFISGMLGSSKVYLLLLIKNVVC